MLIAQLFAAGMIAAATPALSGPPVAAPTSGAATAIDTTTTTDEVAIGNRGDRMTVAVSVGGNGPYRFLVDTGSERTVISRQLADRLRLVDGRNAVLHSVIGAKSVQTVFIPRLKVSESTISVANAPALEATHIGADGLLGLDGLKSKRVLFDFKAQTMSITPAAQRVAQQTDGDVIVVRAKSRKGRLIFTQARVNGEKVAVIIDTGSQVTVGNLALKARLMKHELEKVPNPLTIESVTGETLVADVSILKLLELDSIHLDKLPVAFADAHIFKTLDLDKKPALLLGMNAMRAFDQISIDFASRKVRFVLPETSMLDDVRMAEAGPIIAAR
jgi:predicted aspartyl protease